MTTPQLTYALSSNPQPLVANANGELSILVSNNIGQFVMIGEIQIAIPGPGGAAQDLSNQTGAFSTSVPSGWSNTTNPNEPYVLTFKPDNTEGVTLVGPRGLEFQILDITVNTQPGSVDLTVTETSYATDNPETPITGTVQLACTKADAAFSLGPLIANPSSINDGDSTVLEWSASGEADYTLAPANLIATDSSDWQPDIPIDTTALSSNTVFTVTATSSGTSTYLASAQAYVSVAVPEIQSFAVDATTVAPGHTVNLSWTTTNATSVAIFANGEAIAQTEQVNCDAYPVIPIDATTQYTIVAAFGPEDSPAPVRSPVSEPVIVTFDPPAIPTFAATETELYADTPAVLTWSTQYADLVMLEDQNGNFQHVSLQSDSDDNFVVDGYVSQTWTLHAFWIGIDDVSAMSAMSLQEATAAAVSVARKSLDLNYVPCPLMFDTKTGITDGQTKTLSFDEEFDQYMVGITGFSLEFDSGDGQQLEKLYCGAKVPTAPASGATSFDISASLQIENHSDKTISSSCGLDVIGIARRKGNTDVDLGICTFGSDLNSIIGSDKSEPLLGLSYFNVVNDHSHEISGVNFDASVATGTSPNLSFLGGQAIVYNAGSYDDRYTYDVDVAAIAAPANAPCGFEIQLVGWGSSFATFKHPVADAALIVHHLQNFTDASNHDVEKIWSSSVTGTVADGNTCQLNLSWPSTASGFDNGSDPAWNGNTRLLVIARYLVPGD